MNWYWDEVAHIIMLVKAQMLDDITAWDMEFYGNVQIDNIEKVTQVPPSTAKQNFVGSVDSMSSLHHRVEAVDNIPSSVTQIMIQKPQRAPISNINGCHPRSQVSNIHDSSYVSFAESTVTEMYRSEMYRSEMDDVKVEVQVMKEDLSKIKQLLLALKSVKHYSICVRN
jgi:hypothetical protein